MRKSPAPSPRPVRAVLFDAYGTLFDVYSVALRAEQLFPGQGQALSRLWRDKQIEYSRLVSTCNEGAHYQPFWALTGAALRHACAQLQLDLDDSRHEQLMNQYRHLSAYPENREVLQALRERGVPTGILSNGDPQMLGISLRSAGLESLLDHVISVEPVRRFKPHPQVYQLGVDALGLPAEQILFVSSNGWDALGATWFGYTTLWVNRAGMAPETIGPPPTHVGSNLREVLALVGAPP